jgi:hypothetical protein
MTARRGVPVSLMIVVKRYTTLCKAKRGHRKARIGGERRNGGLKAVQEGTEREGGASLAGENGYLSSAYTVTADVTAVMMDMNRGRSRFRVNDNASESTKIRSPG